jgi:hypothetical protein
MYCDFPTFDGVETKFVASGCQRKDVERLLERFEYEVNILCENLFISIEVGNVDENDCCVVGIHQNVQKL